MPDDVKPYTTPAAVQDAESRVVFELEGFPALIDYVRRLAATARAGLADTERIDHLEREGAIITLVRSGVLEWQSKAPPESLRAAIDKGMQRSGRAQHSTENSP